MAAELSAQTDRQLGSQTDTQTDMTKLIGAFCNSCGVMKSSNTNSIYEYMNCKRKLLHCNTNINFNKICLKMRLVPKYAMIKFQKSNEAARKTQTQIQPIRIKNEIKFLYKKK
jgi:hypothetical protein